MRMHREKMSMTSVAYANDRQNQSIAFWRRMLKKISEDVDRKKRLEKSICPVCFYRGSRVGGAACSQRQCSFCDEILHSGNTCVDMICSPCAKKAGLCCQCGADVNLKNKRVRVFPESTPELPSR